MSDGCKECHRTEKLILVFGNYFTDIVLKKNSKEIIINKHKQNTNKYSKY